MKRTLQKGMLIAVLLGLVIPTQAATYLDIRFLDVIEQSATWLEAQDQAWRYRHLDKIDGYLIGGANVNQQTLIKKLP